MRKFTTLLLVLLLNVTTALFAQIQPVEAELEDENSFSMILFPDPQSYIKFDVNQPIFELMTAWAAHNVKRLNIEAVLCTGDLVEQNEWPVPDGINGNQTGTQQWENVSRAFERLDGVVPYINCTGNHDYGYAKAENRLSQFPKYFPVERNSKWRGCLVSVAENYEGRKTLENAAYEFNTESWGDLLVISVEFAPRDEALEWAKNLAESDRFKSHRVFVLTHSFMNSNAQVYKKENYKVTPANFGEAIWEKLIYPTANIEMLICGHACRIGTFEENVSFRIDKDINGRDIPQMMFNAQTAGGGWNGNGGDGWLRIMEFMPDGKTIKIKTFSPFFAISPTTAEHAWRIGDYDQFDIVLE